MSNIDYTGTGTTLSIIPYSEKIGTVHAFLNGVVIYTTPMSISFDYGRTWKPIGLDSDPTFVYEPETEDDLDVMIFTYGIDKHYVAYNDGNVYSLKFFDASLPKYLNTTIYDKGFFINKEHFIVQLIDSPNTVMYWFDALDLKNSKIVYEVPNDYHKPIEYELCLLKNSKNNKEAKKLIEYLKGEESKKIFSEYGFEVN